MTRFFWIRTGSVLVVTSMLLVMVTPVNGEVATQFAQNPVIGLPLLLAKSWAIGYTIVGLAILLGTLAVLISSMRKVVRKKTT